MIGRNPCFSGQCFAMHLRINSPLMSMEVAILVLVDSVLQLRMECVILRFKQSRNPCFSGQCFAIPMNRVNAKLEPGSQSLF